MESHLLQMRGLKLSYIGYKTQTIEVASFTDAWIETQAGLATCFGNSESHLLQMRGLKHRTITLNGVRQVASFTDAWIETHGISNTVLDCGRIFYRCVD